MNREQKLLFHLAELLCSRLPKGKTVNAKDINAMIEAATEEDKQAAYERALTHIPLLLDDEKEPPK